MFHDHRRSHGVGFMLMTLASVALTIPFMCYMRRMADSLERIADKPNS